LGHPDQMKDMAENGRTDILKRFNWDAVAEKYLELFNSKK
jgi:glycosyltransferase involved in cell wall biosynthesis